MKMQVKTYNKPYEYGLFFSNPQARIYQNLKLCKAEVFSSNIESIKGAFKVERKQEDVILPNGGLILAGIEVTTVTIIPWVCFEARYRDLRRVVKFAQDCGQSFTR